MLAANKKINKQNPNRIVVAVPVSPKEIAKEIAAEVDELICINNPELFLDSVGSYYEDFSDEKVIYSSKKNFK